MALKPECKAVDAPALCGCKQGHKTQFECYHWPCPCAAKARAYYFTNIQKIEREVAKRNATRENPVCVHCQRKLASPGYVWCDECLREQREAPKVAVEGKRQIEVE